MSEPASKKKVFGVAVIACVAVAAASLWWQSGDATADADANDSRRPSDMSSLAIGNDDGEPVDASESAPTIEALLDQATEAVDGMSETLWDYTATFVKRERSDGKLGPEGRMFIRAQTRFGPNDAAKPRRVYLRFEAPEPLNGREVLWGEDLYDGKMAVHETAFLLNLKTIWLDPEGLIAMQGQRYPISEIGLVKLAEKLVERGESLREEPNIRVAMASEVFDGADVTRYRIERDPSQRDPQASIDAGDFAIAEVVIDFERNLVLEFASWDWPEGDAPPALIESYAYRDVQTNVGLEDDDFRVDNPAYDFP